MTDEDLLIRYRKCAPNLSIQKDGNTCSDCMYVDQDTEVDVCNIHAGMYHDWDMPESTNFVYRVKCGDFATHKLD